MFCLYIFIVIIYYFKVILSTFRDRYFFPIHDIFLKTFLLPRLYSLQKSLRQCSHVGKIKLILFEGQPDITPPYSQQTIGQYLLDHHI
ncbi:conserved hypothetical protein [Streptococcus agalactiae CJB111]|nr:conserved hypothetical protein [Streptococcus agalactiae CJB111]